MAVEMIRTVPLTESPVWDLLPAKVAPEEEDSEGERPHPLARTKTRSRAVETRGASCGRVTPVLAETKEQPDRDHDGEPGASPRRSY
jgi:hypothetical protein